LVADHQHQMGSVPHASLPPMLLALADEVIK
jgi:hypothetical protein